MSRGYDTFDVPRPGGSLRVGRWGSGPVHVLAAHGVTANHVSFRALADQLPDDVTLLAPDLRGRGGSSGIAGPYGMPEHADDLVAVLDHLGVASATVVGHSMGGFVAVVAADRHPDRIDAVVLVDGGLPLDLGPLAQLPIDELVAAIIGPSLQRLRMTFRSAEEYLDFWRPHPALRDSWNDDIEAYLRYDLVGTEPELRSGVREEAVLADSESDLREGVVERAVLALRQPAVFLRAPRGLTDGDPLFPEQTIARWQREVPALVVRTVPDVNHYTIALTGTGATAIAEALRELRGAR
jgi:pimeloyl-ACP methyl ester carboxylesterase